ncbi:MAG: hypothetical protein LBT43_02160 [Prevotella sp.]|jgi:hypothetical protein|nr:hypothetical protein [Prevotella sp.]
MEILFDVFSTREIALFIWTLVFLFFLSRTKSVRQSMVGVLKAFFEKKLIIAFSTLLLYVLFVIFILQFIGYWDISLLKDTILWILFSGFILFMNVNKIEDVDYFAKVLKDNIKVIAIWEFVFNFYTFNLVGELIFIPTIFFFTVLHAFAKYSSKREKEHIKVVVLCKNILGIIGFGVICYITYKTITEYELLFSFTNLKSFILPILLVLLTLPYFYVLAVFMRYENLFIRINSFLKFKGEKQVKIAKKQTIIYANISLTKLSRIDRNFMSLKTAKDIKQQIKTITKKPLHKKGILGTTAQIKLFNNIEKCRELLSSIEIWQFSEWRNIGNSFQSITPYYELPDSYYDSYVGLPNNIACYLSGKETYIKQLNLTLNLNNKKQKESALLLFKECITKISDLLDLKITHDIFKSINKEKSANFQTEQFFCRLNIYKYERIDTWEFIIETKENS